MGERSAAILRAVTKEIQDRAGLIDACEELAEVTVTVKLQAGTSWVRSTTYTEERIARARSQR